jgi:hypothetical protein
VWLDYQLGGIHAFPHCKQIQPTSYILTRSSQAGRAVSFIHLDWINGPIKAPITRSPKNIEGISQEPMVTWSRVVKKRQTPPRRSHWHPFTWGRGPGLKRAASWVALCVVDVPTAIWPEALITPPTVLVVSVIDRHNILTVCVLSERHSGQVGACMWRRQPDLHASVTQKGPDCSGPVLLFYGLPRGESPANA